MKILLVNPSCLDPRIQEEDSIAVPMGLYFIGALLKENKYDVSLINLAGQDKPQEILRAHVAGMKPDLVGISVLNATRFSAMETARTVKAVCPAACVVFGGPAATFLPEFMLNSCPELDLCVIGEGEITFLEIAALLAKTGTAFHETIPGIAFRKDNTIYKTRPRALIQDLDTLPHPGKYFPLQHLALSRGCPGRCRFCGSPQFWETAKVRFHSASWFVDHLELLTQKGIRHFYISDDTFTMDRQRVIKVCQTILERNLAITWAAISRADFIQEDILYWMRRAGCIQISYGVESGSEKIRKTLGKPMKQERIIKAFQLSASYGILPRAYFIYGSPGETQATMQESIDLLLKIKPLSVIFYILVVFPGTALYNSLVKEGRISEKIWHEKIEDIPWFQLDPRLDFKQVKMFGNRLRQSFFANIEHFAAKLSLKDDPDLYPCHADFLSRLAMTFSHGDYAGNPEGTDPAGTAERLFEKALTYSHDSRAYLGLAMLQQKNKNFSKAVSILEKGLAIDPDHKNLTLCMAVSLMNLGRFNTAMTYLDRFKADPGFKPYIDACLKAQGG